MKIVELQWDGILAKARFRFSGFSPNSWTPACAGVTALEGNHDGVFLGSPHLGLLGKTLNWLLGKPAVPEKFVTYK
jgi:hypothetical protein